MNLYIKQKVFSFGDKFSVYDEFENQVYYAKKDFISLGAKVHLYDMNENELIFLKQVILSFLPAFELYKDDLLVATLNQKFSFLRKKIEVESSHASFAIEGDVWDHNYTISCNDQVCCVVNKAWLSWGDVYSLDIKVEEHADLFIAIVLAIDSIQAANNQAANNQAANM